jgi:hypothetical protein
MKIIGISGPARSGKDTLGDNFANILQEWGIKCNKQSFANQLKIETDDFLQKTLGISAFTQKDEEKNIIRPLLVTWGTHVRRKLDPDVWIKSVEKSLCDDSVTIISDVRFENELQWVKDMGGYSVFVDRYTPQGTLVQPANKDEEEHTMKLRSKCDHSFVWDTISNEEWLVAIAYEVLMKTVPEKELETWTQTCH